MSAILQDSLAAWWPETVLSAGALLAVLLGAAVKPARPALVVAWLTLLNCAVALWRAPVPTDTGLFFGLIVCDRFSLVFRWIALGTLALVLPMLMASQDIAPGKRGESYGLLLLIGVGLMLMAEANHLLMAYVAMELVSLSSYVLVGFRDEPRSAEASLKYLLFGALSSGIMLFGMSLLFGLTGQLSVPGLFQATAALTDPGRGVLWLAAVLLLAGLSFKISMVPFHMWTPDVYEGAPLPVTALLSVGPKAAGFALLVRLMTALQPVHVAAGSLLIVLAIATMTLGNVVALAQTNVKRLLAYSTIGQVGYMLIGFIVGTPLGYEGLLLYLVAYVFMNLGAFACTVAVVAESGGESLEVFRGLSRRSPVLAMLLAIFLLSLAGIPPLLGFFGKFLLFGAALEAGQPMLAIAGVLNSAAALYYYVNIIRLMYVVSPAHSAPVRTGTSIRWALGLCAAATVLLGLYPGPLMQWLGASHM